MAIVLDNNGGLIQSSTGNIHEGTDEDIPTSYTGSEKHLIKLYDDADHGWTGINAFDLEVIRQDVIRWFYGHK